MCKNEFIIIEGKFASGMSLCDDYLAYKMKEIYGKEIIFDYFKEVKSGIKQ